MTSRDPQPALQLVDFIRLGPATVALFDRRMNYLAVSSSWLKSWGRGYADLVGRNHYDVHADIPEAWKAVHRAALAGETVRHDEEQRWVQADGSEQWLHWTVLPWRDEHREIGGIIISAQDVTFERALRISEAKFRGIVSVSADAIISHDDDYTVTMFNEGAEKIFGYAAAEVLGKPLDVLIPERFRSAHLQHVAAFSAGGDSARPMRRRNTTIFGLRKNGEEFPVDAAISKIQVEGKKILTVILRDVTERERLHRALEGAVRARDEVLGVVAHDLRNPLNAILFRLQGLRRHGGEPERRNVTAVDHIRRASQRMNTLIQDLLDVARLEAGQRLVMRRQAISPAHLVNEVVKDHQERSVATKHELLVNIASGLPDMWADADRIHQVFDNLLGNALKFAPSNTSITLEVSQENGEVMFRVANESIIAAKALPHIFERFWKGSKADLRGAGLGLSIVKHIVDSHEGRIWVESVPEHGTSFSFTVPIAKLSELEG
jgi:PAS domain S-box-containing protein